MKKQDKRFDNITCEFGAYELGSGRLMEPLVMEMHEQMLELKPIIFDYAPTNHVAIYTFYAPADNETA